MRLTISLLGLILTGIGYSQEQDAATAGGNQPPTTGLVVRQGESSSTVKDVPQSVMFMKSDSADAKAAIANVLLSDTAIRLITTNLVPGMAWNPYMNETLTKVAKLGRGMLSAKGTDVKGFEYDTLPGLTAGTTLKSDKVELLIPLDSYRPSADFSVDTIEPVLLRLETRPNDQMRILASRRVTIKEEKKGRFDFKPTSSREEAEIQERPVPIDVERQPGNVLRITSREPLEQGEYALVLRTKGSNGSSTQNVALKPTPGAPAAAAGPQTPEEAMAAMYGAQGMQAPPQQQKRSMFGIPKAGAPNAGAAGRGAAKQPQGNTGAGFLAWDFRVLQN